MNTKDEIPVLRFEDQVNWEAWLGEHHGDSNGVWLMIAKKGSGARSVTYAEAVESAIAYGWIDSQKGAYDEKYFIQKFTPRGPKSVWSKINRDRAIELMKTGRMKTSGIRQVELAKTGGEWDRAYEPQSQVSVPPDLQEELDKNREAKEFFLTLNSINRYAILFRIKTARKPETRQARIKKFVEMLSKKEKLHP